MAKKYVSPKCVDLSFSPEAWVEAGTCSYGSAPAEDTPCWNGNAPTGYDGECATGTSPTYSGGGYCGNGTTPSNSGLGVCETGSAPA